MSLRIHKSGHNFLVLLYFYQLVFSDCVIENVSENNNDCNQLWHFFRNGGCYCGISDHGVVYCDQQFIYCKQGTCVTWSNITSGAEIHRCLFTKWNDDMCSLHDVYRIPTTATGETLNHLTCGDYNRQGSYCSQCIDGYGPAVFSDDATCADCSKHRHLWILNLVFQLCMVTILCLVLMLFQIKGTSSPLNVIIMCAQMVTMGLEFDRNLRTRLSCYVGRTLQASL